jgi:hypothetical protein
MYSRRRTRVGRDLEWRAAARLVLLALILAAAAALAPAADDGRLRLRLVWYDILRRTPFPLEVMSAEVERILGGERVDVTWRVVEGDGVIIDDSEVKVILLDRPSAKTARDHRVMGATRPEGSSTAWVYSSSVAGALGLSLEATLPLPQQQELARALARVVAHEIVHAIAPEVPHAPTGLMQSEMDRKDLLGPGLGLRNAERRAFEAKLASFVGEPPPLVRSAAFATPGVGPIESAPAPPSPGGPGSSPLE